MLQSSHSQQPDSAAKKHLTPGSSAPIFIAIYNTKFVKFFDKDFLDLILNNVFIDKPFFHGIIPYNIPDAKITIFKAFYMTEENTVKLKALKRKFKVKDRDLKLKKNSHT